MSKPPTSQYESATEFLLGRINYEQRAMPPYQERTFKLDRMRRLLSLLGDPHERLKVIHIAGTKGKGSVAAMITAALVAAGYRTGTYTSPHLERLEERFAIDGRPCLAEQLVELVKSVRPAVEQLDRESARNPQRFSPLTYFEITTAMAMLHFVRQDVDLAVLEVGLGGRLDSTNVCLPLVSVITSISLDHTKQLGSTIREIAAEKAGIIKPGVPVISSAEADEALREIARIARDRGSPLWQLGRDFHFSQASASDAGLQHSGENRWRLDFDIEAADRESSPLGRLRGLRVGLLGSHQAANAAAAVAALDWLAEFGHPVPPGAVRAGLASARCQARVEVLRDTPPLVIDAAHNSASVEALLAALDECFPRGARTLVFSTSRDKDAEAMLRSLLPKFDRAILTQFRSNPRATAAGELQRCAERIAAELSLATEIQSIPQPADVAEFIAVWTQPGEMVCVTGSFFIAAELRGALQCHLARYARA